MRDIQRCRESLPLPRSENWIYQPLAEPIAFDERLVLAMDGTPAVLLDGSAQPLWDLVVTGSSHDEIIKTLAGRYNRAPQDIEADISPMLDRWLDLELIDKVEVETPPPSKPCLDACYQIGSQPVRLRCHVEAYAAKIEALYRPAKVEALDSGIACLDFGRDAESFYVARNGKILMREEDQGQARGGLLVEFLRLSAPDQFWLACLHASAVAQGGIQGKPGERRCLLFSGDCGAGKTTLTLGMVHAGYQLVADDMLPIDRDEQLVWPLPFAMSLKAGTVEIGRSLFEDIADLPILDTDRGDVRYFFPDGRTCDFAQGGLSAAALIFPQFEPGAELSLQRLDRADALTRLARNGSALDLTGYHLRDSLAWLQTLPCYRLHYGDLDQAIGRLNTLWSEL